MQYAMIFKPARTLTIHRVTQGDESWLLRGPADVEAGAIYTVILCSDGFAELREGRDVPPGFVRIPGEPAPSPEPVPS